MWSAAIGKLKRAGLMVALTSRASVAATLVTRQSPVEIVSGTYQRQMRECLGEVSEMLARGSELLGEQPEVVGVAEHFLEQEARLREVARARQAFDVPEAAHVERAFAAEQAVRPVLGGVTKHQAVVHELLADGLQGRQPAGIGRADEADQRHEQAGGVEGRAPLALHERLLAGVPESA